MAQVGGSDRGLMAHGGGGKDSLLTETVQQSPVGVWHCEPLTVPGTDVDID